MKQMMKTDYLASFQSMMTNTDRVTDRIKIRFNP